MFSDLIPQFGGFLFTIGAFVAALSVIVTIHEYGHYIVGRWSGIQADVFSLGFGPRLVSRMDRRGTRWQIAAIPLGGYVKFRGDADAASAGQDRATLERMSPAERRATLEGAPLWARAATVAAGPVFNFISAIVIFAGLALWQGTATERITVAEIVALPDDAGQALLPGDEIIALAGQPTPDYPALFAIEATLPDAPGHEYSVQRDGAELTLTGPTPTPLRVAGVAPGSAADAAGLAAGDVITAVDGQPLYSFAALRELVEASEGAPLDLAIWRPDAAPFTTTLAPRRTDLPAAGGGFETRWLIGISGDLFFAPATRPTTLPEALERGARQTVMIVTQSLSGLKNMITGAISSCNLRGAITIADTSAAAAQNGLVSFIGFIGLLSVAVGFLNLMPVPVLDGGHLAFYAYEAIARRPAPEIAREWLSRIGLALVLALMVLGLSNDLMCP